MNKIKSRYADISNIKDNNNNDYGLFKRSRMNKGNIVVVNNKNGLLPKELELLKRYVNDNRDNNSNNNIKSNHSDNSYKDNNSKPLVSLSSNKLLPNDEKYKISLDINQSSLLSSSSSASSSSSSGIGHINANSSSIGNSNNISSINRRMFTSENDDDYGYGVALEVGMAAIDTDAETQFALLAINNSEIKNIGSSQNQIRNHTGTPTQNNFEYNYSSVSSTTSSSTSATEIQTLQTNNQILQQRIMKLEFELETLRMENEGLTEDKKMLLVLVRSLKSIESEAEKYRAECLNLRAMNNELHEIIINIRP